MDDAVVHHSVTALGFGPLEPVELGVSFAAWAFSTSLVGV